MKLVVTRTYELNEKAIRENIFDYLVSDENFKGETPDDVPKEEIEEWVTYGEADDLWDARVCIGEDVDYKIEW